MKTLFLCLAMLMAGCSYNGRMIGDPPDQNKNRSVFIEPFAEYKSYPELYDYASASMARVGYDAITDEKSASYRLRSGLTWSLTRIVLSVRLIEASSGRMVYFGECKNPGWGTMLAASSAMSDCFDLAFSELR